MRLISAGLSSCAAAVNSVRNPQRACMLGGLDAGMLLNALRALVLIGGALEAFSSSFLMMA